MEQAAPNMPKEFLFKILQNEINSGFALVAAARKAYATAKVSDGNEAIAKAEALHDQLAGIAGTKQVAQARAITHQLSELRASIDWLLTGFEPSEKPHFQRNS